MKFLKLEDYLPKLNTIYSALSQLVRVGIPYAEVDHIGSSAIQGAISKGDLDVLVRVPKDKFNDALGKIKEFGFSEKAGSHRTDSLCNLESKNYEIDVAIQGLRSINHNLLLASPYSNSMGRAEGPFPKKFFSKKLCSTGSGTPWSSR